MNELNRIAMAAVKMKDLTPFVSDFELSDVMNKNYSIGCVVSVYMKTELAEFETAINSIFNQTLKAKEITIVADGEINHHLNEFLFEMEQRGLIRVIRLNENFGPGYARHIGILNTNTDLIAIMDSDDASAINRFEIQHEQFLNDYELCVLGGTIEEKHLSDGTNSFRRLPREFDEIIKLAKIKSPVNNVTAMMKKKNT
ncbi:glycosyltransferase [Aeromonas caviae]